MSSDKDSPAGTQLEESQRAALENQGIKTVTDDDGNIRLAAGQGQLATDQHGNPLVTFDPVAVRKLRWKLDLFTVPTVALLYLFCFIDRANIGKSLRHTALNAVSS